MRKHWIDNLRWVTVLLVLFYHVIYYYNGKGVVGGIGGFGGPQYQDFVMYLLYPWFMPLLFLLAGISARYALDAHSEKEWFQSRTRKLLVPATIGLFVFQWIAGYFNTHTLSYTNGGCSVWFCCSFGRWMHKIGSTGSAGRWVWQELSCWAYCIG